MNVGFDNFFNVFEYSYAARIESWVFLDVIALSAGFEPEEGISVIQWEWLPV